MKYSYRKRIISLVGILVCFLTTSAWAAAKEPLTLEATNLYYNEENGAFSASGNVRIQQVDTVIVSDEITGDVKTGDVLAHGNVTWTQLNNKLSGNILNYNYKSKEGTMDKSVGSLDGQLVSAGSTELHPGHSIIHNVSVTKCPAKEPDYKMTAEKVVIYPGEKLIAYNAAFWFKDMKLFSMAKFVKSLEEDEKDQSAMPKIGASSEDGVYVKQYLGYPLNDKLTAFADLAYYTKRGFEPQVGLIQRNSDSTTTVTVGATQNSDGEWYKRQPEITFVRDSKPVGNLPVYWSYKLQAANISDDIKDGMWQESATLYLSHKPITLAPRTTLNIRTYYQENWYEDQDNRGVFGVGLGLNKQINADLSMGLGYNYTHENQKSPFAYDNIDVSRELVSNASWRIDHLWTVGIDTSYDMDVSRFEDVDYTIKRKLHCFEAVISYREKRDELRFHLHTAQW